MRLSVAVTMVAALALSACGGRLVKKQYEYEEEMYLALDGSATLNVNASVAALVTLRGVDLNSNPRTRFDRDRVRRFYEGPGVTVTALSSSRRYGRRFVHVSMNVADVRASERLAPFAWSSYKFAREGDLYEFKQTVGPSAGTQVSDVGWDGTELVAFRMHLPSRITYHNAPSHRTERGNILEWEQTLADRIHGMPIEIDVQLETQSIFARTMMLFATTAVAALATLAFVVWWMARKGQRPGSGTGQEVARG
jgi:hypothetical protein